MPHPDHPNEDALVIDSVHGVAAVFDGLGGHGDGAVASRVASEALTLALSGPPRTARELVGRCREALNAARDAARSADAEGNPAMSTTCVVARRLPGEAQVAWCGDSRAYRITGDGVLMALSEDHDLLHDMVMRSMLSPVAARGIRRKVADCHTASDAFRAAGGAGKKLFKKRHLMTSELASGQIDTVTVPLSARDLLLMTTDGAHDNLLHAEMQELVAEYLADGPEALARALIDAASGAAARGEGRCHPDDITVAILS